MNAHVSAIDVSCDMARQQHCDLLDLAALLAGPECDAFFAKDGVHYDYYDKEGAMPSDPTNQPGLERIAEELDKKIRAIVNGPAWQSAQAYQSAQPRSGSNRETDVSHVTR